MRRRNQYRGMGILMLLVGVVLAAASIVHVISVQRVSPPDSIAPNTWVYLGFAVPIILSAWGLWHETRWGWMLAIMMIWLLLILYVGDNKMVLVSMGVAILLGLYDLKPAPLFRPGSTVGEDLDRIASALGVEWANTANAEIATLIREGKTDAAAKRYREFAAVSWDQASYAVANWDTNELERKLRLLARHADLGTRAQSTETGNHV